MIPKIPIEPSPDHIIRDLHRIREAIMESYGGDLKAYTADCEKMVREMGWPVWNPADANKVAPIAPTTMQPSPTPTSQALL